MEDNIFWLDDRQLRGVQGVRTSMSVNEPAEVELTLLINPNPPRAEDVLKWKKAAMVREEEWKQMMSKKAQALLDELS